MALAPPTLLPPDGGLHVPRRPAAALAKYAAVYATSVRNQLAYAGELAFRGIFLSLILFVFLRLWQATYGGQDTPTIAGFTVAQMVWYLAITESIVLSRPRFNQAVDQEVRTGDVAYTLVRPYSYAAHHCANYLGERTVRFVTTLAIGCALALLYVGPVPLSPANVAYGLVALALGVAIDFAGTFGIALLAFWIEDTWSVNLIYDRLIMLLGGMMLPLEVFPGWLAGVARALPFSAVVYGPARVTLGGLEEGASSLLLRQAVTLLAAWVVVWLLYRRAFRRISVNGG
jgi:ABC-2 type transport system permease protein